MDRTAYVSHLGHVIKFDLLPGPSQPTNYSADSVFSASERQTFELQAKSFKFSLERRSFEEETQSKTHALRHDCADGRIVLAQCIRESHTGVIFPCVLVQSRVSAKDLISSLFFYVPSSNKIFLYGEFTSEQAIPKDNVHLTDGPAACWRVDEMNQFFIAKRDAENGKFRVHWFVDVIDAKASSIMYCSMQPDNDLHIITTSKIKVCAGDDSIGWMSLIWNPKDSCHLTDSKCFVPGVYASIACCMLLEITEQENVHISLDEPECCGERLPLKQSSTVSPLKNTAYVATSMKQLLKFKNGVFCKLASIPFDDAVDIVSMETRGEKMLAVRSRGGEVCVISCTSFQVIQECKNVMCLLVDNILGNGRDQLLLLLNSSKDPPKPFPEFILTDLDLCHITSSDQLQHDGRGQRSDDGQSAPTPRSLITAMQALEAKVENGLTSLREQERSKRLKDRIISQSVENLAQMANGMSNPIQRQPTLVHLCGTTPSNPSLAPTSGSDTGGRLKVTGGWQRIVNEKWVIGFKVTNENQWAVSGVKLLIWPWKTNSSQEPVGCEGCIQHSVSRGITVDSAETESQEPHLAPPSKRTKLQDIEAPAARNHGATSASSSSPTFRLAGSLSSPASPLMSGGSCDAVAMTTIPEFLDGPVASRLLVLQWTSHRAFPQGAPSGTKRPRVMSVICGSVHLAAADVVGSKLDVRLPADVVRSKLDLRLPEIHPTLIKPLPLHLNQNQKGVLSRTDKLAMDASQLSTSIRVTSRYTSLQNLHSVLLCDMGFQELEGNTCLCKCNSGLLRGARVYLENVRSHSAQLRVCTRDKRELMLFFHTLKSSLPVDVQFTSDTPIEQMEEAIKQCVTSMNKELQHMQNITELACSTVDRGMNQQERDGEGSDGSRMEIGDGSDNSSHEQERIKRLREEFLKQQQSSKSKDCTMASNQAESLRVKLVELRGNTDTAVTVLGRCI
eukprot:XP_003723744.1 PREDICTED: uncharacterized protein LOC100893136 [Strongylocentrotus purpuratus]